jgi:hypothetical protein
LLPPHPLSWPIVHYNSPPPVSKHSSILCAHEHCSRARGKPKPALAYNQHIIILQSSGCRVATCLPTIE